MELAVLRFDIWRDFCWIIFERWEIDTDLKGYGILMDKHVNIAWDAPPLPGCNRDK